jgi:hypothetical protein
MSELRGKTAAQRHEAILTDLAKLEVNLRELARQSRVRGDHLKHAQLHSQQAYYAGMADAYYTAASKVAEVERTARMLGGLPGDTFSNQT